MKISFSGPIASSKSLFNRALLTQSFFPALKVEGYSESDDVRFMRSALEACAGSPERIDCGEAGTVFRFVALRASRYPGQFLVTGSPRLLSRPQTELLPVLRALGVEASFGSEGLRLKGEGWQRPDHAIFVDRKRSSQFASALLLSAWDLPFPLEIDLGVDGVSEGYWQMSLKLARELGMKPELKGTQLTVPDFQEVNRHSYEVEADCSSAFAAAALGTLGGIVEITNWPATSLQPDSRFVGLLREMHAPISIEGSTLRATGAIDLRPLKADLLSAPDLFPVLATLAGFADGATMLSGLKTLKFKESDRVAKTAELLRLAGIDCETGEDSFVVHGRGIAFTPRSFAFDPDADHRMAMAAGLLRVRQSGIRVLHPEVVAKSFPEFWRIAGGQP